MESEVLRKQSELKTASVRASQAQIRGFIFSSEEDVGQESRACRFVGGMSSREAPFLVSRVQVRLGWEAGGGLCTWTAALVPQLEG